MNWVLKLLLGGSLTSWVLNINDWFGRIFPQWNTGMTSKEMDSGSALRMDALVSTPLTFQIKEETKSRKK